MQCNLVDNQNQQKSEVFYTFMPNKSYAYLWNEHLTNLVFLITYNAEYDDIIITFIDQNDRLLKVEEKVSFALLINKWIWHIVL